MIFELKALEEKTPARRPVGFLPKWCILPTNKVTRCLMINAGEASNILAI
jgi:hypothetical protein